MGLPRSSQVADLQIIITLWNFHYSLPVIRLNLLRLCSRSVYVGSTTKIAMMFPYFNQVMGIHGGLNFWPLSIYFPVEIYFGKLELRQQSGSCFELSASCACLWHYSPWLVRLKDFYKCKTELESALESFCNGKEDARLKIAIDSRRMIKLGLNYFFWRRHCWIFMEKASTFSGL